MTTQTSPEPLTEQEILSRLAELEAAYATAIANHNPSVMSDTREALENFQREHGY